MAEEMKVIKRCAACRKEKPVSEMKVCMHAQMHNYVCDSKCMNDFYNPPKKPAQLPSQGGEAVAWRVTGRDGLTVTAQYPEWAEADCLLTITPLYTRPADQVEDDLTMVKVSRELLQDLRDLAFDQVEHHRAAMGAYKQTRQSAMDSVLAQADALLRS